MLCLTLLMTGLTECKFSAAGDWPQILGPARNGISTGESVAKDWPGKLTERWSIAVGQGYAGVAVAQNVVYLYERVQNQEILRTLDTATAREIWRAEYATRYQSTIAPDNGPRCVPVVTDDKVIILGAGGYLRCLMRKSGELMWEKSLATEFKAPEGYFGFGSTPLVWRDRVIVNVGGAGNAGVVAFALEDGKVLWQAGPEQASYSSPILVDVGGQPRVVCVTRLNCLLLDPTEGKILSKIPFGQRGPTVNGANPVTVDERLFLTASYGIGAKWITLAGDQLTETWANDDTLSSQYTTSIAHRGLLYGIHGRQDVGVAELRCIDPARPGVVWGVSNFGTANLILAGDLLIAVTTDGQVVLFEPAGEKSRELARTRPFGDARVTVQALPALAGGALYVRSENELKCLELPTGK
ncbi:MAG: PQQ-binding-like beta-propeller repeat protein [Pirellulales bacterium]|nr:PQQ-binding-like beta-propeller repeat protein [Pirellulales bacterium]